MAACGECFTLVHIFEVLIYQISPCVLWASDHFLARNSSGLESQDNWSSHYTACKPISCPYIWHYQCFLSNQLDYFICVYSHLHIKIHLNLCLSEVLDLDIHFLITVLISIQFCRCEIVFLLHCIMEIILFVVVPGIVNYSFLLFLSLTILWLWQEFLHFVSMLSVARNCILLW